MAEIDYSHRVLTAHMSDAVISAIQNQPRLQMRPRQPEWNAGVLLTRNDLSGPAKLMALADDYASRGFNNLSARRFAAGTQDFIYSVGLNLRLPRAVLSELSERVTQKIRRVAGRSR